MKGKLCVVTGANSGIGKAMATALARDGAHVVLVCRNATRGAEALADIRKTTGSEAVSLALCDLGDLDSVRAFATDFLATGRTIDVLANNAGIYLPTRELSKQGFESMLATNHLGPFLLTNLLLDRLEGARVIQTASFAHAWGTIDLDDLSCERRFRPMRQYGATKLANILFTRELARRAASKGVVAHAFHPGAVGSGFAQDAPGLLDGAMKLAKRFLLTPEEGADTGLFLATDPRALEKSGAYWSSRKVRKPWGQGTDDHLAGALWNVSEKLVGLA